MRARWIALVLLAAGCVFRNAGDPRFFRPESTALDAARNASPQGPGTLLRLRTVRATPLLRERIVWRASAVEYGLYEQRRWSELPASYVERALASALGATPGIQLSEAVGVATLRVEVLAFDEVRAPAHLAAVALAVSLEDREQRPLLDRTFQAEAPIAGDAPAATATAMGTALDSVVAEVARAVGDALRSR